MNTLLLSFYTFGDTFGYIATWFFGLLFAVAFIYAMVKYMKH